MSLLIGVGLVQWVVGSVQFLVIFYNYWPAQSDVSLVWQWTDLCFYSNNILIFQYLVTMDIESEIYLSVRQHWIIKAFSSIPPWTASFLLTFPYTFIPSHNCYKSSFNLSIHYIFITFISLFHPSPTNLPSISPYSNNFILNLFSNTSNLFL